MSDSCHEAVLVNCFVAMGLIFFFLSKFAIADYGEARRLCKKAEVTSDLQSDMELSIPHKRIRRFYFSH